MNVAPLYIGTLVLIILSIILIVFIRKHYWQIKNGEETKTTRLKMISEISILIIIIVILPLFWSLYSSDYVRVTDIEIYPDEGSVIYNLQPVLNLSNETMDEFKTDTLLLQISVDNGEQEKIVRYNITKEEYQGEIRYFAYTYERINYLLISNPKVNRWYDISFHWIINSTNTEINSIKIYPNGYLNFSFRYNDDHQFEVTNINQDVKERYLHVEKREINIALFENDEYKPPEGYYFSISLAKIVS